MSDQTEDILQRLAFQRGVLTLLKEKDLYRPIVEKAIEELDSLMEKVFSS